jgi:hypothetical protein
VSDAVSSFARARKSRGCEIALLTLVRSIKYLISELIVRCRLSLVDLFRSFGAG